jgi:hypothetical protein
MEALQEMVKQFRKLAISLKGNKISFVFAENPTE